MAARGGAAALGWARVVGQIKAGLKADLALFDLTQSHLQPHHDVTSHLVY